MKLKYFIKFRHLREFASTDYNELCSCWIILWDTFYSDPIAARPSMIDSWIMHEAINRIAKLCSIFQNFYPVGAWATLSGKLFEFHSVRIIVYIQNQNNLNRIAAAAAEKCKDFHIMVQFFKLIIRKAVFALCVKRGKTAAEILPTLRRLLRQTINK